MYHGRYYNTRHYCSIGMLGITFFKVMVLSMSEIHVHVCSSISNDTGHFRKLVKTMQNISKTLCCSHKHVNLS